jgi:TonB family protein
VGLFFLYIVFLLIKIVIMVRKGAGITVFFFVFALAASSQRMLRFDDIWYIFNQPFPKTDSFLFKKGYKLLPADAQSDKLTKTFTGPVVNRNVYKVIISRAHKDSLTITGIGLDTDMQEMDSLEKDLARHKFVVNNPGYSLPGYAEDIQLKEWISIKYFLVCAISFNYPKQWQCHVNFAWHDLIKGSIPVYKKENNPYLTPALLREYDTTQLLPYANNLSFSSVSDPPAFRGGRRGLFTYLNNNVRYPAAALADSIEAEITVAYTVDESGKVVTADVIKGSEAGHGLPEEAIRLFIQTPLWRPGRQQQEIVTSSGTQVIVFKIRPSRGAFLK